MKISGRYTSGISLILMLVLFKANVSYAENGMNENLQYTEALMHFKNQEFDKTVNLLSAMIQGEPKNSAYHTLIGQAFIELKRNDKAREHLDRSIALNNDDFPAYFWRAMASEDMNEQEYWLKQANKMFPYELPPYALLISNYMAQAFAKEGSGDVKNAVALLEKARKVNQGLSEILDKDPDRVLERMKAEIPDINVTFNGLREHSRVWLENTDKLEKEWKKKHGISKNFSPKDKNE